MKIVTALKLLYKGFFGGDEYSRYLLAEGITQLIYPRYKFSEYGRLFLYDDEFIRWYESFESTNYRSLDRKYVLDQLMQLVTHIEGDTAECGAFRGASSYLICRRIKGLSKRHHIFDSFEGLSEPRPEDGTYWRKGDLASPEEIIRHNLGEFDFVDYYKGWIPDRFQEVADRRFCFVHIDVDLYEPTLKSLEFFYERMSVGGIILCDDYGFKTCPGAKKAMDEFFEKRPEKIVSLPTGQGFIVKRG